MKTEHLVLFELIRLGLNPTSNAELKGLRQASVDWQKVYAMARQQKVYAIVFDGLQELYGRISANQLEQSQYPAVMQFYTRTYKPLKMDWMSKIMADEEYAEKQMSAVAELGRLWKSEGLHPYLLKGLSYAQFYPKPKHRLSTDVDTFQPNGWELSNQLVERCGIVVDGDYYKNSTFTFKDVIVENHVYCTPVRGDKRRKEYEMYLQSIIADGETQRVMDTDMASPSPMFNALYFMSHAHLHFLIEGGISLRHICDWAMLMKAYAKILDWNIFDQQCHRFGFDHFAWAMSYVALRIVGIEDVPYNCPKIQEEIMALIAETMHPKHKPVDYTQSGWTVKLQVARSFFQSRWKYKMFSDQSMWVMLFNTFWAFFFDRTPKLNTIN